MPLAPLDYLPEDLRDWNAYFARVQLELEALSVTSAELANSGVTTSKLDDLAVTTAKLAASAVTTAKIADLNVTTGKLADNNVTFAKIQDLSADTLIGSSAGGDPVEISCTAAGRALLDDASATAQRTTLGLGTAATQNTGTSGANVPLLSAANTWSAAQTHSAPPIVPSYTVATLPSASPAAQLIYVSDETGGAVLAFSDNTNWRRVTDRAIVS